MKENYTSVIGFFLYHVLYYCVHASSFMVYFFLVKNKYENNYINRLQRNSTSCSVNIFFYETAGCMEVNLGMQVPTKDDAPTFAREILIPSAIWLSWQPA